MDFSQPRLLRLDLNLYTRGQVQLRQRIHCSGRRRVDVQKALVRSQLELLTALFVNVGRTQNRKDLLACRQGNWTRYYCACATNSLYNFLC